MVTFLKFFYSCRIRGGSLSLSRMRKSFWMSGFESYLSHSLTRERLWCLSPTGSCLSSNLWSFLWQLSSMCYRIDLYGPCSGRSPAPCLSRRGFFFPSGWRGKTKVEINTAQALYGEEELNSQISFSPTWPEKFTLTNKDKGKRSEADDGEVHALVYRGRRWGFPHTQGSGVPSPFYRFLVLSV